MHTLMKCAVHTYLSDLPIYWSLGFHWMLLVGNGACKRWQCSLVSFGYHLPLQSHRLEKEQVHKGWYFCYEDHNSKKKKKFTVLAESRMFDCLMHKVTAWLLRVHILTYFYIFIYFLIICVLFNDQRSNKKIHNLPDVWCSNNPIDWLTTHYLTWML